MSPDQQIEKLRRAARLSWIPNGLIVLTLVVITLGFMSGLEIFIVVGVFAGLAAIAAREAAPHRRNAIAAIQNGWRSNGDVSIAITRDSTAFDRYVATVRDEPQQAWKFEFTPNNWVSTEGKFKAEIYYLRGVDWPALLITERGILFPAFTPEKLHKSA